MIKFIRTRYCKAYVFFYFVISYFFFLAKRVDPMSIAGVAAGPLVDLFGTMMARQDAIMDRAQNRELADETALQMENHHRALVFQ